MRSIYAIVAVLLVVAGPSEATEHQEINASYPIASLEGLHLDFSVAEIRIEGSGGKQIEVQLVAECSLGRDCKEALDELRLEDRRHGKSLYLELEGYPKWGKGKVDLEGTIKVPKSLEVDIDMGVGELEIEGLERDIHVELGVGEVNLWLDGSSLRSVDLDTGVGEVELHGVDEELEARRSMLVGAEIHWGGGPGKARVFIEVGVGEVSAWVE